MRLIGIAVLALVVIALFAMVRIVPGGTSGADAPAVGERSMALVIPVAGVRPNQLADSWQDPREGGARAHNAIDIAAPRGTPVHAAMAGRVEKLFASRAGGTTVYVRSADGGWIGYYAHLAAYYPGIVEGVSVKRGQQIGFVGDTGNAGARNYHLHFALHRMARGEPWHGGTPVNPYPLLVGSAPPR